MDTTPFPTDPQTPTPETQAREILFDQWRKQDHRRHGVMARQGYYAGFTAALNYLKEQT